MNLSAQFIFFVSFAVSLCSSCKKNTSECTLNCQDAEVGIEATGFSDADIDTFELRRYSKNSQFNDLNQVTFVYDRLMGDPKNIIGLCRLSRIYDWQIYLPASSKTYSITDITDERKESATVDCKTERGCINGISFFRLNGDLVHGGSTRISK